MSFPFAPWEYPYWRENLLQHETVSCDGYSLQLTQSADRVGTSYSVREGWLFFRSLTSQDEANFAVTGFHKPFVSTYVGTFANSTSLELQDIFWQALDKGAFMRLFFLDHNGNRIQAQTTPHILLVVNATGLAKWNRLYTFPQSPVWFNFGENAPFRWTDASDPARFLSTPAHEIWAQIQGQLQQPDSDCALARRTLYWSREEWLNLVFKWKKGTQAELKQVLKAALMSQTRIWENGHNYRWYVDLEKLNVPWHRGRLIQRDGSHRRGSRHGVPAPDFMRRVLHRISPYFELALDEDLLRTRLWAENWWMEFLSSESTPKHIQWPLSVECVNPTAHERLEAALFWQEWQDAHPPAT